MSAGLRAKLTKVIASGTGTKGKNLPAQKQPKCVPGRTKPAATCGRKTKKEVVTSVGS